MPTPDIGSVAVAMDHLVSVAMAWVPAALILGLAGLAGLFLRFTK